MKKIFVVMVSLLFIVMAGCGSSGGGSSSSTDSSTENDSISSKIATSGGELETPSGNTKLDVPAGSLSNSTSITMALSTKNTPPGNIASAYDFTPDGQTFSSPVTICMKYDPDSIPEGMSPSDLRLGRLSDNEEWETTGTSTVDTTNYMVCGQTNHFSTYSIVIHERKAFGEKTGEFNSVIAYSNGTTGNTSNINNTYNSYATGMKWQSDEYVNRYYKQIYGKQIRVAGQIANDYYQNAAERGLTAYHNDGSESPQVGDILVSEYGDGHLSIVREVQHNKIFIIQQNWSNNGADNRYPIARNGNHVYPFDGKKGNYAVKGWLRDTSTPTYSISGTVYGAGVSGVTITLTGTATASTTTDGSGNYTFTGLADGSYAITPAKTGYTFTPSNRNVTVSDENESNINFTSAVNVTPTYTISGTVSGAVVSGVTITLTGTGSSSVTTDPSGNYSFAGATNGNYTLTAFKTGYSFTPTSISATVNNANVTGQNFTATANTYTISGTVSGDIVSGVTITLAGTGSVSTTTDGSGNYSFTGAANGSYTITASKTGYTFSPTSINATVNNANLISQNFTATAIPPWTQKTDFGGVARNHSVGFSIESKGYIGTGWLQLSSIAIKDFWEYDSITNTWTQKADFGGGVRGLAVGFSIGNKGYVGTGYDSTTLYKDFWEFNPVTNIWTRKADFGGTARADAVGFGIGSKGYIGTAYGGNPCKKDFWEYDPTVGPDGTWTQKEDFGGAARGYATALVIGSKGYVGLGYDSYASTSYKDFWEYDPATNIWTRKADFGGAARSGARGFSIGSNSYIGMGFNGSDLKDFWEYTPGFDE